MMIESGRNLTIGLGKPCSHTRRSQKQGTILSMQPMGNDVLVEVAFDKKGNKKIMANFAKLKKL